MDTIEILDSCQDDPSWLDLDYVTIFGEEVNLPDKVFINSTEVQNQALHRVPSTASACTCFGASHCINEANVIEKSNINTTGEALWNLALLLGAKSPGGWTLIWALELIRKEWFIESYTKVFWLHQIKQALANNQLIFTWSSNINRKKTQYESDSHIAIVEKNQAGHCFMINGYDDEKQIIICRNSFGPQYNDNGHFYLRYEDVDCLFSTYAITDFPNIDKVKAYKKALDESMLKEAQEQGIWNGLNWSSPATREEVVLMIMRGRKL